MLKSWCKKRHSLPKLSYIDKEPISLLELQIFIKDFAGIGNILILFTSSLEILGTGTILETPVVVATQTLFCESIARPFTFGPARPSL